jgi:Hemopexin
MADESTHRPKRPVRPIEANAELTLTPGGARPRSLVYRLQPGEHISTEGGRVRIIKTATGEVVKDLGDTGTPTTNESAPSLLASELSPGISDMGWIENSQWRNDGDQPIIHFATTWVVPPAPTSSDNQVIFLFNAMQPDTAAHILQPVLQWGKSEAGGGNFWSITNWYADGQGGCAVIGHALIQVNPGDVLQGIITCTGQTVSSSGTVFSYKSSFVGHPTADVTATDVPELTWAYETLECYGTNLTPLTQCSDYPATPVTPMYNIEIKTGTPGSSGTDAAIKWSAVNAFTDCGQRCSIVSNASPEGSVYLYYSKVGLNAGLYVRYDQVNNAADVAYPVPTGFRWSGMSFTDRVDAAFSYNFGPRPGKAYFFRDDEYIRYDLPTEKADPGYPAKISAAWSGMSFTDRVDAVFKYDAEPYRGKAFFFRADECICYDLTAQKADPGYPKKIGAVFPTMAFQDRIDAVVKFDAGIHAGKAYFFRDDEYIRYDLASNTADSGYPEKISDAWSGMPFTDKVKSAINYEIAPHAGKVYFFKTATSTQGS